MPPTQFSWLGASGLATEQASGAANPGGGGYVAQLGAPLQTEPITPPGAYGHGSYNGAVFTPAPSAEALAQSDSYGAGAPVREAERLQAQREEAAKHAYESECHLASCVQDDGPGEGNCEANCWVNEEEYYYDEAQEIAEAQEASDEGGTSAKSAAFKLRLSVGCLEAGFWTYCSGEHDGKWGYGKTASNTPLATEGVSTGVRVGAGVAGA